MMIGPSEIARFCLLVVCIGLMAAIIAAAGVEEKKAEPKQAEMTEFVHESGAVYLIRVGTIVAVYQPKQLKPHDRTEILLQGGHSIRTTADIDDLLARFGRALPKGDK